MTPRWRLPSTVLGAVWVAVVVVMASPTSPPFIEFVGHPNPGREPSASGGITG